MVVAVCLLLWTVLGTDLIDFPHQANPTALPGAACRAMSAVFVTIALVAPLTTVSAVAVTVRRRWHWGTPTGRALGPGRARRLGMRRCLGGAASS